MKKMDSTILLVKYKSRNVRFTSAGLFIEFSKKLWVLMWIKPVREASLLCIFPVGGMFMSLRFLTTVSSQILQQSWLEQHFAFFGPKVHFLRQILDYNSQNLLKFEQNSTKKSWKEIRTALFYLRQYGILLFYKIFSNFLLKTGNLKRSSIWLVTQV